MIYLKQELMRDSCPYCGELIELAIDCSIPEQQYIEDCQVCCRPIQILASIDEFGTPIISLIDENS